jgi:hypothetical protein
VEEGRDGLDDQFLLVFGGIKMRLKLTLNLLPSEYRSLQRRSFLRELRYRRRVAAQNREQSEVREGELEGIRQT